MLSLLSGCRKQKILRPAIRTRGFSWCHLSLSLPAFRQAATSFRAITGTPRSALIGLMAALGGRPIGSGLRPRGYRLAAPGDSLQTRLAYYAPSESFVYESWSQSSRLSTGCQWVLPSQAQAGSANIPLKQPFDNDHIAPYAVQLGVFLVNAHLTKAELAAQGA